MKRLRTWILIALIGLLVCSPGLPAAATAEPVLQPDSALFQFHYPPDPETFIFELRDPAKILLARRMLAGEEAPRAVMGTIVKEPLGYNPPWSFHLDPDSISFFRSAIEVCDASIAMVEAHLEEVCGAFLPGCEWCPWGARLTAEIQRVFLPTIFVSEDRLPQMQLP